jgi:hypothetical protein
MPMIMFAVLASGWTYQDAYILAEKRKRRDMKWFWAIFTEYHSAWWS